ncbi:MAG TPA: DNA repair protein RecO [Gammaproteobacteria bacterium]|jgi:DNA repair protein RecO (recombination protein O)|nr:DNA repair protein RecO [Gammaproteobacteria bacterium]
MPRVIHEPAFLLHARAYRETSALLEMLTRNHGRVGLIYKGAKRSHKRAASLQPFCKLSLSWSGRGELYTLMDLEMRGMGQLVTPRLKICGLYLNELIMNLVPRNSPSEALYHCYETALGELSSGAALEPTLRQFELYLLRLSGYGPQLEYEATSDETISRESYYYYDNERGPVLAPPNAAQSSLVSGRTLLALQAAQLPDATAAKESKRLLRSIIDYQLRGKSLLSREIMKYLVD